MSSPVKSGGELITPMPNITDLMFNDPNCTDINCLAYYNECKMMAKGQDLYGAYTAGLYCLVILIFMIRYARRLILNQFPSYSKPKTTVSQRVQSVHRWWTYRQTTGWVSRWVSISYGQAALMVSFFCLVVIAAFAETPYYRICTTWGMPPPLANRTGAMAVSLTPLVIALSQKWNLLTYMTGITHDRLNVLHRTIAPTILVLSIIHLVPFFVYPFFPGGGGWTEVSSHLMRHGSQEASGFAPLVVLIFLCTLSIPYIRHRFYEGFVLPHIVGGALYVGLLFYHTGIAKRSYRYLYATVAIWVVHMIGRALFKVRAGGIAEVEIAQENVMRITITDGNPSHHAGVVVDPESQCKGGCMCRGIGAQGKARGLAAVKWRPAQHAFLRFPTLGFLENHPFAITSACNPPFPINSEDGDDDEKAFLKGKGVAGRMSVTSPNEGMVFLVKPQGGMTRKVLETALFEGNTQLPVWIDGPYGGGHLVRLESRYDSVSLVAAGTGIGGVMSVWESLSGFVLKAHAAREAGVGGRMGQMARECVLREVRLVWIVRNAESVEWVRETIERIMDRVPPMESGRRRPVRVEIHVTRPQTRQGRSKALGMLVPPRPTASRSRSPSPMGDGHALISGSGRSSPNSSHEDLEAGLRAHAAPVAGQGYDSREQTLVDDLSSRGVQFHWGRPEIPDVVRDGITTLRNAVIVCGPNLVVQGVSNTVADCQARVMKGEIQEVKLIAETFGW